MGIARSETSEGHNRHHRSLKHWMGQVKQQNMNFTSYVTSRRLFLVLLSGSLDSSAKLLRADAMLRHIVDQNVFVTFLSRIVDLDIPDS